MDDGKKIVNEAGDPDEAGKFGSFHKNSSGGLQREKSEYGELSGKGI